MANKVEIEIAVNAELNRIAIESKMIIEQFQKLLGVYTTTEALGKIAVLMREEEAESLSFEFIRKVRDGEHHAEHDDEPCRCNEIAAAKFLNNCRLTESELAEVKAKVKSRWI